MTCIPPDARFPLLRALALAGLMLAGSSGLAAAHDYTAGSLKIGHPWSRATPGGAKVAGGYVTVTNTGAEPDRLVGGSLDEAGRTELHSMSMQGDVMKMAPIEGGVAIAPGETIKLAPGGNHMMFLDLKTQLKQGARIKGTLVFEKAGTVPVEFAVESIAAKAPAEGGAEAGHDHSGHKHAH